jgi:hypothetical protein
MVNMNKLMAGGAIGAAIVTAGAVTGGYIWQKKQKEHMNEMQDQFKNSEKGHDGSVNDVFNGNGAGGGNIGGMGIGLPVDSHNDHGHKKAAAQLSASVTATTATTTTTPTTGTTASSGATSSPSVVIGAVDSSKNGTVKEPIQIVSDSSNYSLRDTITSGTFFDFFSPNTVTHNKGENNTISISNPLMVESANTHSLKHRKPLKHLNVAVSSSNDKSNLTAPSFVLLNIPHIPQGPCEMSSSLDLVSESGHISLLSGTIVDTSSDSCSTTATSFDKPANTTSSSIGFYAIEYTNSYVKFWKNVNDSLAVAKSVDVASLGTPNFLVEFSDECDGWNAYKIRFQTRFCSFSSGMFPRTSFLIFYLKKQPHF